jgi:hypothetical protein
LFNSRKKKAEQEIGKMLTASALLKAAMANDMDQMEAILFGNATTDEQIWSALQAFIMAAHKNPAVIDRLREIHPQVSDKADIAFTTAIQASETGNPRLFQGGNETGQAILIIYFAGAIAGNPEAMVDVLGSYLPE